MYRTHTPEPAVFGIRRQRTVRSSVFHGVEEEYGKVPSHTGHSQEVQDQGGGMNDAQIRDKVKRADQTGKPRRENVRGVACLSMENVPIRIR